MTKAQIQAYAPADNKLALNAGWAELVRRKVDVIFTSGTPPTIAAKRATSPTTQSGHRPAIHVAVSNLIATNETNAKRETVNIK